MATGIGAPVRRKEDARLLRGAGSFSDDVSPPGQAQAFVVRSVFAHATIKRIDVDRAKALGGVLAVLTGADFLSEGYKPIPLDAPIAPIDVQRRMPDVVMLNRDGPIVLPPYYPLATGRVRFVGEAVVLVVAETLALARDAAELVEIDYEALPSVTATAAAAEPNAPRVWENMSSNILLDADLGDSAATDRAFAGAAHVASIETWIQRVTGVPMETRSAVGTYDPKNGHYLLQAGCGNVLRQQSQIATMFGIPPNTVHVVSKDIGGSFGTKNHIFPEYPLVLWASRRIGRPVKWTCDRNEAFLSDYQGRDMVAKVELALDANGKFLAMRGSHLSNVGALGVSVVPLRKSLTIFSGVYDIPIAHYRGTAVLSNTPPTSPYRSAGRPESTFIMERLCDLAALKVGIDRIDIRRRNLIAPDALPYRTALGVTYDNGTYEIAMNASMALADWDGFSARRATSLKRGRLRGIGLANYIECTMGYPREWSKVTVLPGGEVEVAVGTLSSGQGHETSFAQCVSDWLQVPFDAITLVQGDTDVIPVGGGSHSGRSMRMAGFVMGKAAAAVVEKSRRIAAQLLAVEPDEIQFADGRFKTQSSARSFDIFEVAEAARSLNDLADDLRAPLSAECDHVFTDGGYPYGCAVCEIEIDPDTGTPEIVRYSAVDDVGRAINPLILDGQTHGAIAQGVGQALWEQCVFDPDSGQVLTGSFMDYAMPRADRLLHFDTELMEVLSPSNPLGVRAGGEGGTTPALAAVINAVVDALKDYGVIHMEMPATPERIWRAIKDGKGA